MTNQTITVVTEDDGSTVLDYGSVELTTEQEDQLAGVPLRLFIQNGSFNVAAWNEYVATLVETLEGFGYTVENGGSV